MRAFAAIGLAVAVVFASPPSAHTDVIILDDGTVVECKIKEIKYPDPKQQSRFVIIAAVDEKGTLRNYKSEDIKSDSAGLNRKAIYVMKTRWEKRAEYLKEYTESKIRFVKDTWESQQSIGKWCKARLLPEKGLEHYKKALALRLALLKTALDEGKVKPEEEVDQQVRIAKWCQKELGLFDDARARFEVAYALKKKQAGDAANADVRFALGRWCESVDLDDAAMAEYQATIGINPKHSSATSALSRLQNSIEYRFRALTAEYGASGRAWELSVAIEDQADAGFIRKWEKKIQDLSQYVWDISEGQFFIAECEIEDLSSDGRIIIEKGKMSWRGTGNKEGMGVLAFCIAGGSPEWVVHCSGENGVGVVAHEIFHGIFGLPDEYYQDPQCDCVMRSAPNPQKFCNGENHIGTANRRGPPGSEGNKDCWKIIQARKEFKDTIKHPNPSWEWAKPGQKSSPNAREMTDGMRNGGGTLTYRGLKTKAPPNTVFRIVDN